MTKTRELSELADGLTVSGSGVDITGTVTATAFSGDGSGLTGVGGGGLQSVQIFTTSGTWTRPSGITKVKIYVTGGGGGGYNLFIGEGQYIDLGGAGGGTAIKFCLDVSSISSSTITVGAGANRNGTGGTSSWSDGTNTISATGGQGSTQSQTSSYYRTPGIGSGGDINMRGGVQIRPSSSSTPCLAGGTFWTMHGLSGSWAYGAGAVSTNNGADGVVVIEEYA